MSEPTFTISIDRTALAKAPLVFSGTDGDGVLGAMNYQEPGAIPRVQSLSPLYTHGEVPLAWSFQQGLIRWSAFADSSTEVASKTLQAELVEAVTQWPSYEVTVNEDGAQSVWTCHPGSVEPEARTRANLVDHNPVWTISLPCYPVPVIPAP